MSRGLPSEFRIDSLAFLSVEIWWQREPEPWGFCTKGGPHSSAMAPGRPAQMQSESAVTPTLPLPSLLQASAGPTQECAHEAKKSLTERALWQGFVPYFCHSHSSFFFF